MARLSSYLQRSRLSRIAPYVKGDVLDLGCANAAVLATYQDQITSYTGVERNPAHVAQLQADHPEARFVVRDLDTDALGFSDEFDTVLLIALIEHLFNQRHAMEGVRDALRSGGRCVLTTPTPFGNDIVHRAGARVGLFAPSAVDDHIVVYNRQRFGILAREVGFDLAHYQRFQVGCNQIAVLEKA